METSCSLSTDGDPLATICTIGGNKIVVGVVVRIAFACCDVKLEPLSFGLTSWRLLLNLRQLKSK
jgi:hypothetical protein